MPEDENQKLYTGSRIESPKRVTPVQGCEYAELDVATNFSFLRGASHPDELVYTAALIGYSGLAITDINTVAGTVRAYEAARKIEGFKLLTGARLVFNAVSEEVTEKPYFREAFSPNDDNQHRTTK